MPSFDYDKAFSRNIGWVTEDEQQRLRRARVAVGGLGGVGGVHLLTLARLGIGAFSIADFDVFDIVNFNRQVGATGTWVTARVYVAVGISGAIQHLQGIGACDKVVAINMDPGCDMIKRADLSVIGDSAAILQALIEAVDNFRNGARRDAA